MINEWYIGKIPVSTAREFKANPSSLSEVKKYIDPVEGVPGDTIVLKVDDRGNVDEFRYLVENDPESFIGGFIRSKGPRKGTSFYISKIQSKDPIASHRKISRIFDTVLTDLSARGVTHLETSCVLKLAPILMKRYSFTSDVFTSKQVQEMQRGIYKYIPGFAIPLERDL